MVDVDISTVDVELIKSGCMFLVNFLSSSFGLVVVLSGREVKRGFRAVACRISPLTVVPTVVDVVNIVVLTNTWLVEIVVEPRSVVTSGFMVAFGIFPLTVDSSVANVDIDTVGIELTTTWSVDINVEPPKVVVDVVVVDVVVDVVVVVLFVVVVDLEVVVVVVRFEGAGSILLHLFS